MTERDLIIDYELVRGLPGDVEERVKGLIGNCNGWQLKGLPTLMKIDGCDIIVQCMVKLND